MILIETFIVVRDGIVPLARFEGPVADPRYIEGAIELTVDGIQLLGREQVDYVDQLWAYLATGLEEVVAGRDFLTYFPDMPIEISLRPKADLLALRVDSRRRVVEATATLAEFVAVMVPAGITVFETLARHAPCNASSYALAVQDLQRIAEGAGSR